jgi:hypothetical protein
MPLSLPTTITQKITRFYGIEIKLYAVHFVGTLQLALWAAGPYSGYGLSLYQCW